MVVSARYIIDSVPKIMVKNIPHTVDPIGRVIIDVKDASRCSSGYLKQIANMLNGIYDKIVIEKTR